MHFGQPDICPPYYFLYFPQPQLIYYSPNIQQEQLNIDCDNVDSGVSSYQKLIITKEDLQREGYEQTKKAWTEEQDQLLLRLSSDENIRFQQIASKMQGRNAKMCYSRYRRLTNQSKDCWSNAQNDKLRHYVDVHGQHDWRAISSHFPNRNYQQLKSHYENYLRPNLCNERWTLQEDIKLINTVNQYGQNWKQIQRLMVGRSRNQIKNRYFGRIKRINARKILQSQNSSSNSGNKLSLLTI